MTKEQFDNRTDEEVLDTVFCPECERAYWPDEERDCSCDYHDD